MCCCRLLLLPWPLCPPRPNAMLGGVRGACGSLPMQKMHWRPSARILRVFLLMSASLSPKVARRSEWPESTYCVPTLLSIEVLTAAV